MKKRRLLLSLLSQKSKKLVRFVGIKLLTSHIMVGNYVFFTIPSLCLSMYFYKDPQDNQRVFVKPKYVWISATEGEDDNKKWHEMKLPNHSELKEWIEHILYIFNTKEIFQLCFDPGFETFDLGILKSVVGNLKVFFSLLSRKTKELVKSLSIKRASPEITIKDNLWLRVRWLYMFFYKQQQNNQRMLGTPNHVWVEEDDTNVAMKLANRLGFKEWIKHILYIFNVTEFTHLFFHPESRIFDMETLKDAIGNFKEIVLDFRGPEQQKRILNVFLPRARNLCLTYNPFSQGDLGLRKIVNQNLNILYLGYDNDFERFRFNLNDMLACNASEVILRPIEDYKWINQFFKLWIMGSNPRLQSLEIDNEDFSLTQILKGIKVSRWIPADEDIVHKNEVFSRGLTGRRAVDIYRFDGTRASIGISGGRFWFCVFA
ncbi:hypothetical protein CAEBREN_10329 [Caenorhabditis brenneri]|uniref:Sdz-33 F-box domain-containing protein n=1 Tax=Caenorhabditis brenneri TaxID=135651 RepID=G0MC85_CAEBE|nr:hypothetical protein CAEBREN_10329 [Caenorhabditis brenneri]